MVIQESTQIKERYTESDKSSSGDDKQPADQSQYLDQQFALMDSDLDFYKNSLRKINKLEESMKKKKVIQKEVDNQIDSSTYKPI